MILVERVWDLNRHQETLTFPEVLLANVENEKPQS